MVDEKGQVDQARVLKAKHRYALMTKVKREWEIGLQVGHRPPCPHHSTTTELTPYGVLHALSRPLAFGLHAQA